MKNTIKTIMYSLVAVLAIASVQSNADFLGIGKSVKENPKYTTAIGAGALAGAAALGAGKAYKSHKADKAWRERVTTGEGTIEAPRNVRAFFVDPATEERIGFDLGSYLPKSKAEESVFASFLPGFAADQEAYQSASAREQRKLKFKYHPDKTPT